MTYTPLSIYTIKDALAITSVAIGRSDREGSDLFLFTGGSRPMVMLLSGDHVGHAYETANASVQKMLIVEDVEFQVDESSMFVPAFVRQPVGALFISPDGTGITALRRGRIGFIDLINVYFDDDHSSDRAPRGDFGFSKWRIVKRVGNEVFELLSFEAKQMADH